MCDFSFVYTPISKKERENGTYARNDSVPTISKNVFFFLWLFIVLSGVLCLQSSSVLRNHNFNDDDTRKHTRIGTRKCDPHSEAGSSHNHATKDPDSSTKDDSSRNIQRTTRLTATCDERVVEHGDDLGEQRGSGKEEIEPRSYRDVVVNDGKVGKMMT